MTLSTRNLLSLASKTLREGSARILEKHEGGKLLLLVGETDAQHYGRRRAGELAKEDEPMVEWGVEMPVGEVKPCRDLDEARSTAERLGRPIVSRVATPWATAAEGAA